MVKRAAFLFLALAPFLVSVDVYGDVSLYKTEYDFKREWQKFYKKAFNLEKDFSKLAVPKKKPGFNRLIIVARDLRPEDILEVLREELAVGNSGFTGIVFWNVEKIRPDEDYAVWVRDRIEADKETKGISISKLKNDRAKYITIEEWMLFQLMLFKEKKKRLDVEGSTICAGSWDTFYDTPLGAYNTHKCKCNPFEEPVEHEWHLKMGWYHDGDEYYILGNTYARAREVIK